MRTNKIGLLSQKNAILYANWPILLAFAKLGEVSVM